MTKVDSRTIHATLLWHTTNILYFYLQTRLTL
jgi:hypothetical protein